MVSLRRAAQLLFLGAALACTNRAKPAVAPPPASPVDLSQSAAKSASAVDPRCRLPEPATKRRTTSTEAPNECPPLPAKTERTITTALGRMARNENAISSGRVHVSYECSPLRSELVRVWAWRVYGHNGSAIVLGAHKDASEGYVAQGLRVRTRDGEPTVELLATNARVRGDAQTMALVEAALTANARGESPESSGKQKLQLRPLAVTSANVFVKAHLEDTEREVLARQWTGYPGTDQPDRLSIELAVDTLVQAVAPTFVVRSVTEEDRRFLADAWDGDEPWFAEAPLLVLAGTAGSPAVLPQVLARLDSKNLTIQRLAVAALAAITGWDLRNDSHGNARPLADVVADYRRACVRGGTTTQAPSPASK